MINGKTQPGLCKLPREGTIQGPMRFPERGGGQMDRLFMRWVPGLFLAVGLWAVP